MGYLRQLPNIRYESFLPDKNSSKEFILIKNLFRKNKLLDSIKTETTIFDAFLIADGARPDTVAEDIYGSPDYDFVVIISSGITHIKDEWPLSSKELYEHVVTKYGLENINAVHNHETTEVRDANKRLILPAGKVVEHDPTNGVPFQISGPGTLFGSSANIWYSPTGESYTGELISPVTSVSNFEYETKINEEKREIHPLKRQYLQLFLTNHREIMTYNRNSQYLSDKLITTENLNSVE